MDWSICNARIVDPATKQIFAGSVGIENGKIACISPREISARRVIQAEGRMLCPGFIDPHGHLDGITMYKGEAKCACLSLVQGVTSIISGNCGASTRGMEGMRTLMAGGFPVNHGELIGQTSTLRRMVGLNDIFAPANAEQIRQMCRIAEQAMQEGAFGVSYGLGYTPGTSLEEAAAVAAVAAKYGRIAAVDTKLETPDDLQSLEDVFTIGRESGARMQVSHFVYQYGEGVIEPAIAMMDKARAEGLDVWADSGMYVYWATGMGAEMFRESYLDANPGMMEKLLVVTGEHAGKWLDKELYRHMRSEHGSESVICFVGLPESIRIALQPEYMMVSSDTAPYPEGEGHPQIAGSFAGFLHKVFAEQWLEPAEAIRRITLLPAQTFGMPGKGRMEEGCDADLVLFDPELVQDMARFSHEGRPDAPCVGVRDVFVNGVHAVHEGQVLCATAGKLLTK